MSSSDHNEQIKIIKSKTYMDVKLNLLKQMRESKLYLIESQQIAKAYDIKINQIKRAIAELQNICPKNYFKPNQRKDKIVPSNWENLDFNIYNRYNDDINLSINNNIWVKAFHGTGRNCKNENEIRDMIDSILKNGFKNGINNAHADCYDKYHPGKKIGIGVYVTPNIETAKSYAGIIHLNGEEFLTLFLVTVKKDAIRACNCRNASDYWLVNGSSDEIRPVSVLLAKAYSYIFMNYNNSI